MRELTALEESALSDMLNIKERGWARIGEIDVVYEEVEEKPVFAENKYGAFTVMPGDFLVKMPDDQVYPISAKLFAGAFHKIERDEPAFPTYM